MARKNDAFYFDSFRKHAQLSCEAAKLLAEVMRTYDPADFHQAVDKMHAIEQQADEVKHEINDALACLSGEGLITADAEAGTALFKVRVSLKPAE